MTSADGYNILDETASSNSDILTETATSQAQVKYGSNDNSSMDNVARKGSTPSYNEEVTLTLDKSASSFTGTLDQYWFGDEPPNSSGAKTTNAVITFFKGMFGAGILTIPHAFSSTGVILGVCSFTITGTICLITMMVLIECKKIIYEKTQKKVDVQSYEELAGIVFGPIGFRVVEFIQAFLTLVFCTGFMIVILQNMEAIFPKIARVWLALSVLPIVSILSWIPSMKDMWMVSVFGLIVYLVGVIGITLFYSYHEPDSLEKSDYMELKWKGIPHFFGVSIYSLEGINLTLSIASSMKSRRKPGFVMILGMFGYITVTILYSIIAYIHGYGKCDTITQCLPQGEIEVTILQCALIIALIFTHPVYLIVASEIFENAYRRWEISRVTMGKLSSRNYLENNSSTIQHEGNQASDVIIVADEEDERIDDESIPFLAHVSSFNGEDHPLSPWKAKSIRACGAILTCVIAYLVPNLSSFSAFIGCTLVTLIGFILPSIMWVKLIQSKSDSERENDLDNTSEVGLCKKIYVYTVAGISIITGVAAMILGLKDAINNIRTN